MDRLFQKKKRTALLLLAFLLPLAALGAPQRLPSGIELSFAGLDNASNLTEDYLRQMDRLITEYFRAENISRPVPLRLVVDRKIEGAAVLSMTPEKLELHINDSGYRIFRDHNARRKLFAVMIACRLGKVPPLQYPEIFLPHWIAVALGREMVARQTEVRILRSNLYYPILRQIPLPDGLPVFRSFVGIDPNALPEEALDFYVECARLLFHASLGVSTRSANVLAEYLLLRAEQQERPEEIIFDAVLAPRFAAAVRQGIEEKDEGARAQAYLGRIGRRSAFNRNFPRPAGDGYAFWRRLQRIEEKKPLYELPFLAGNPHYEQMRRNVTESILELAEESAPDIRTALLLLRQRIEKMDALAPSAASAQLAQAIAEIEALFLRQVQIERVLDITQSDLTPVYLPKRTPPGDFLSSEEAAELDKAQAEFIR